jgi:hypothetical protein
MGWTGEQLLTLKTGQRNMPDWLNKSKPTRDASAKQEKRLAKTLGGRTTPNSGARFGENDVLLPEFEIEAKTTEGLGYRFTVAEFEKAEKKTKMGKSTLMVLEFTEANREFVVMDISDFKRLTDGARAE